MCDRGCFSQMGDVLSASLRVSKLQKLEKGSISQVHNGVHLIWKLPPIKALTSMLFTVNERSLWVWLNQIALWDINDQNGGLLLLMNLLFQISFDFVIFETNFRDGFLNQSYAGLTLNLIRENQKIL